MYKSFFKRFFDLVLAGLGLLTLLPAFLLISVLILIDSPGPILYKQKRLGKSKKPFTVYKFRTMAMSAEELLSEFLRKLDSQELGPRRGNHDLKLTEDPRVTRIGKFLRKYSLNEIPQFINVLKGDMSLVGPRAIYPFEEESYIDQTVERFMVKPGITGLGQVEVFGGDVSYEEIVNLDNYYARNVSFIFDLEILFKTFHKVVTGFGGVY